MDRQIDRFLLDYFDKNMKKGYKLEDLKIILVQQGYLRSDIDRVIEIIRQKTKKVQEEKEEREKKEKEVVEIVEEQIRKKGFFSRIFGG
ncbi:MAG: hypothetical protein WC584_01670 [Candidatus Pacearchaeota archaeon]